MSSPTETPKPFGYDLRLEVLASIPLRGGASIRDLAEDFGVNLVEMRRIAAYLARHYGLRVFGEPSLGNETILVPARHAAAVNAYALEYWERVHERKGTSALSAR